MALFEARLRPLALGNQHLLLSVILQRFEIITVAGPFTVIKSYDLIDEIKS